MHTGRLRGSVGRARLIFLEDSSPTRIRPRSDPACVHGLAQIHVHARVEAFVYTLHFAAQIGEPEL